ncbi:hypothetical protein NEOLEDRAFT_1133599 [Neolentinus lepideus HHB14362 ss-1]|uniref:MARVEL domain-containing protein n=1 Tax=Neolentinus lepideus HHB14362 ss-1 TaxID=1314782 RepID=A0A165SS62_9AGAM|nr:hypothetical protein NEOLEDRAFT_1133599 [Neolentinus lepideus HHB14362 ss-1]
MAEISSSGKKFLVALGVITVLDVAAVAFSARINIIQEFFFMADLFPLGLSIATLILILLMLILNLTVVDSFLVRAPFQIGNLFVLSLLWLAFNAFSTARWAHIPTNCSSIPVEYPDARAWCRDVQGLKAVIWLEWVMLLATPLLTLRHIITQHTQGYAHIWTMPLVRYDSRHGSRGDGRDSEFLQFEKYEPSMGMAY